MQDNAISTYADLEALWIQEMIKISEDLKKEYIVWEEVFNNGVKVNISSAFKTIFSGVSLIIRTKQGAVITYKLPKGSLYNEYIDSLNRIFFNCQKNEKLVFSILCHFRVFFQNFLRSL